MPDGRDNNIQRAAESMMNKAAEGKDFSEEYNSLTPADQERAYKAMVAMKQADADKFGKVELIDSNRDNILDDARTTKTRSRWDPQRVALGPTHQVDVYDPSAAEQAGRAAVLGAAAGAAGRAAQSEVVRRAGEQVADKAGAVGDQVNRVSHGAAEAGRAVLGRLPGFGRRQEAQNQDADGEVDVAQASGQDGQQQRPRRRVKK